MKRTIAVINQKGGVGKTASAYNLAYSMSMANVPTCLIDLDPSANSTKGFELVAPEKGSSFDFILNGGDVNQYGLKPYADNDNLIVVPSAIRLALAQRELSNKPFRESILSKKIGRSPHYKYIIDCSPTLSDLTINGIYAADFILIPITYEDDALEGLADLFRVIKEIKENAKYQFKILRNQFDARKKITNEYIDKKLKPFVQSGHVLNTIIRQDENINQAKIERKPIFLYAPNSNGSTDFNNLTKELLHV